MSNIKTDDGSDLGDDGIPTALVPSCSASTRSIRGTRGQNIGPPMSANPSEDWKMGGGSDDDNDADGVSDPEY